MSCLKKQPNKMIKMVDCGEEALTSVAMMHSFFSSAITKTDWYIESLEEHIVDIRHPGLSLWSGNASC